MQASAQNLLRQAQKRRQGKSATKSFERVMDTLYGTFVKMKYTAHFWHFLSLGTVPVNFHPFLRKKPLLVVSGTMSINYVFTLYYFMLGTKSLLIEHHVCNTLYSRMYIFK